eukprot:scaffold239332_cov15-Tisochrysis_lutea.AAC.1
MAHKCGLASAAQPPQKDILIMAIETPAVTTVLAANAAVTLRLIRLCLGALICPCLGALIRPCLGALEEGMNTLILL